MTSGDQNLLCCSAGQKHILLLESLVKKFSVGQVILESFQKYLSDFVWPHNKDRLSIAEAHVTDTEANLLASTRLRAPINVG